MVSEPKPHQVKVKQLQQHHTSKSEYVWSSSSLLGRFHDMGLFSRSPSDAVNNLDDSVDSLSSGSGPAETGAASRKRARNSDNASAEKTPISHDLNDLKSYGNSNIYQISRYRHPG